MNYRLLKVYAEDAALYEEKLKTLKNSSLKVRIQVTEEYATTPLFDTTYMQGKIFDNVLKILIEDFEKDLERTKEKIRKITEGCDEV